jgi:hypothetical protein
LERHIDISNRVNEFLSRINISTFKENKAALDLKDEIKKQTEKSREEAEALEKEMEILRQKKLSNSKGLMLLRIACQKLGHAFLKDQCIYCQDRNKSD